MGLFILTCYWCGKTFSGEAKTRGELRVRAKAEGWHVAVPWRALIPAAQWTPEIRHSRVTKDVCDPCVQKSTREMVERVYNEVINPAIPESPHRVQ